MLHKAETRRATKVKEAVKVIAALSLVVRTWR